MKRNHPVKSATSFLFYHINFFLHILENLILPYTIYSILAYPFYSCINGIRPEKIDKVLASYGYIPVKQKGSHKHYLNKETGDLITNRCAE